MLESGLSKDEIFKKTGMTIGVQDASFEINEGEIFVIMGLSGSGKSTLVRLLNRLIEPSSGNIYIDETDITNLNDKELIDIRRKKISMVFQSFALMPHMNILDNVSFGLELSGIEKSKRYEAARYALDQVGLSNYGESYPDELSGGMQQRVGLARALANNPDIMLMDEAFSALDPLIRTEMQDELLELQEKAKRTIVFISHDLDEAMRIGDRIAIMQDGELIQVGCPDEILNNPANDYVRAFFRGVDLANVFSARDVASRRQIPLIKKHSTNGPVAALKQLKDQDRDFGYVVDRSRRFIGVVSIESLKKAAIGKHPLDSALLDNPQPILADTPVNELIGLVAESPCQVPVVDNDGFYVGLISKANLLQTLDRNNPA